MRVSPLLFMLFANQADFCYLLKRKSDLHLHMMIFRTIAFSLFVVSTLQAQTESLPYWSVKRLVEHHLDRYPEMGVEDVYKMLYQANFGVEHLLADTAAVRTFLLAELAELNETIANEALVERISCDGLIVRVNLRPFKQAGMDAELLVRAMFATAATTRPDTLMFRRQWNEFEGLVRYGFLRFNVPDVEAFSGRIASNIIVPIHHSQAYERAYHPAYRIVRRDVLDRILTNKGRSVQR